MDQKQYWDFIRILDAELKPALGCTEPIAVAYAAAKAAQVLGNVPEKIEVLASGNIIKNVKSVEVPNADGMKGIEAAAVLGALGGNADQELEVLSGVTQQNVNEARKKIEEGICVCSLKEGIAGLYIKVTVRAANESAAVELIDQHTNISSIEKNGASIYKGSAGQSSDDMDELKKGLTMENILQFAREAQIEDVKVILDRQIELNSKISEEGLKGKYGSGVGHMLLHNGRDDVRTRARATAAAGSDARMNGCPMPVIINSGSGNQGITASIPVLVYANALGADQDKTYRALIVSNLAAIHQKSYIGSLSAFCGAVCAAAGSGAGITFLKGGSDRQIAETVANTLATIGGMVCDGAKSSCAAKIAAAVDAAITGSDLSLENHSFLGGDGLVKDDPEKTIASIGRMGKEGMRPTDIEILNIMLDK